MKLFLLKSSASQRRFATMAIQRFCLGLAIRRIEFQNRLAVRAVAEARKNKLDGSRGRGVPGNGIARIQHQIRWAIRATGYQVAVGVEPTD